MKDKCIYCGNPTTTDNKLLCFDCAEIAPRIGINRKKALKILFHRLTEEQYIKFAEKIIEVLDLKVKKNGRVDTNGGDKTPLGLGRTLMRYLEESI